MFDFWWKKTWWSRWFFRVVSRLFFERCPHSSSNLQHMMFDFVMIVYGIDERPRNATSCTFVTDGARCESSQRPHSGVPCAVFQQHACLGNSPNAIAEMWLIRKLRPGVLFPCTDYGHSLVQRRFFSFSEDKNTSSFMGSWTAYRHSSKVMLYSILLFI